MTGPKIASGYGGILIESLGLFLGFYAIFVMRIGNFNISPLPKDSGKMVTSGPYSIIRHPMYTAQLIALLPLIIDKFNWWRLSAFLVLLFTLLLKITYEERLLKSKFPDYESYTLSTKKLLPFIY
jgi:protein-S-isoprenylcysteine O-methyltransferase Ste14